MLNEINLVRADLNLLVVFEAVLQERHVGRAADRLSLTPSAVSHGLARLRGLLNDPLFLKTPKGVVPTARAMQLSAPIADLLVRARSILSTAAPFDPATSVRRFTIGAPDGASAVFVPAVLAALGQSAPRIDIGIRQLLPVAGDTDPERAWRSAWVELDAREMDVAIIPSDHVPLRSSKRLLYEEDFVVAMRAGHPLANDPTLSRYCDTQHLVVSLAGDPHGFVDEVLKRHGTSRRVSLTVPNFMFAIALLSGTDLVCALPRRFAALHASRFDVTFIDPPVPLGRFRMNIVVPEVALMDAGLAWLVAQLQLTGAKAAHPVPRAGSAHRQRRSRIGSPRR